MTATEVDLISKAAFLLTWALLNFFWLAALRRPVVAALLSLVLVVTLIQLSQFKHDKLWMTVDFVDLMIIDRDTSAFLLTAMPTLRLPIALAVVAVAALVVLAWRFDPFRVRLRASAGGGRCAWARSWRCRSRSRPTSMRISSVTTTSRNSRARASRRSMNWSPTDIWNRTRPRPNG